MPKLNKATAKKVEAAEGGAFPVIPDGTYIAKLLKVKVAEGPKGPYWGWEYELCDNEEHNGGHQFNNTSLSEAALFRLNETFAAFGETPDTDTDELIGKKVRLRIGHRTAQSGAQQGEIVNDIKKVLPLEADDDEDKIPF